MSFRDRWGRSPATRGSCLHFARARGVGSARRGRLLPRGSRGEARRARPPTGFGEPPVASAYGWVGRSRASTTLKSLLTRTSSSVPALVLTCDSYGAAESPLVSVRSIVAPEYFASTAASTLSLVSPVSGVSLPRFPPGPP